MPKYVYSQTVNEIAKSGSLNKSVKKLIDDKFNKSSQSFNVFSLEKNKKINESSDIYNDNLTLDFIKNEKTLNNINLSAVKLENKQDFYITSDPALLLYEEIPESLHNSLNATRLLSNTILSSANILDTEGLIDRINIGRPVFPNPAALSVIPEIIAEPVHEPFVENSNEENLNTNNDRITIVHNGETYLLGDEISINIPLNFKNTSDGFLLNTFAAYKSTYTHTYWPDFNNSHPNNPTFDDRNAWLADYVNFLKNNNTQENSIYMSSHFLPNAFYNFKENRWEYNVIDNNNLSNLFLSNKQFNLNIDITKGTSENNNFFDFPNSITDVYSSTSLIANQQGKLNYGLSHDSLKTTEKLFYIVNDFILMSPICFSSSYDRFNYVKEKDVVYNVLTNTYGFPNSRKWKTNDNHSINMKDFLVTTEDFLLETVSFEGKLDIRAEPITKKGNIVNNTNNQYNLSELYADGVSRAVLDSELWDDLESFNSDFNINQNASEYITSGINFYLLEVNNENKDIQIPSIKGYRKVKNKKYDNISTFKNIIENYTDTTAIDYLRNIDKSFSDLDNRYFFNSVLNNENFNSDTEYTQEIKFYNENSELSTINSFPVSGIQSIEEYYQFMPAIEDSIIGTPESSKIDEFKSTIYSSFTINEFNNITQRDTSSYYYLSNIEDNEDIDIDNNRYFIFDNFKINSEFNIDKFASDIILNSENSKKILKSNLQGDINTNNKLITHNSITFLNTKNNESLTDYNLKKLNSDIIVQQLDTPEDESVIDIKNFRFNIESNIKSNIGSDKNIVSETSFSIKSNYKFKNVKNSKGKYLFNFNRDNLLKLFINLTGNNLFIYEDGNRLVDGNVIPQSFLGNSIDTYANWSGNAELSQGEYPSDIEISFGMIEYPDYGPNRYLIKFLFCSNYDKIEANEDIVLTNDNLSISDFIFHNVSPHQKLTYNYANNILNVNIFYHNEIMKYIYTIPANVLFKQENRQNLLSKSFSGNNQLDTISDYFFNNLDVESKTDLFIKTINLMFFLSKVRNPMFPVGSQYTAHPYFCRNLDFKKLRENNIITADNARINPANLYDSTIIEMNVFDAALLNQPIYFDINGVIYDTYLTKIINKFEFRDPKNEIDYSNIDNSSINFDSYNVNIDFAENQSLHRTFFKVDTLIPIEHFESYTYEENSVDDEIVILEGDFKHEKNHKIFSTQNKDTQKISVISRSGKTLEKNVNLDQRNRVNYVLNKNDKIAVGMNSFSGFNDIISYARIKDNLLIKLKGRELFKIPYNERFESSYISKSFYGNSRLKTKHYRSKPSDYVFKSYHNNGNYITDTVFPGIGKIYYNIAHKEFVDYNIPDTLDYFLNQKSKKSNYVNVSTNKILLSNKTYNNTQQKFNAILNDWHKIFYMSKYKENFKTKYIEDSERYIHNLGVSQNLKSYIYFDYDAYTISSKMSLSRGSYNNSKLFPLTASEYAEKYSEIIHNINDFLVPKEFSKSSVTDAVSNQYFTLSFKHPGVYFKHKYDNNEIENFKITKDVLIQEKSQQDSQIIFKISEFEENITMQYLQVPNITLHNFDDNSDYKNKKQYSESWCLVIDVSRVNLLQEELDIDEDIKFTNIVNKYLINIDKNDYSESFIDHHEGNIILYDKSCKIKISDTEDGNIIMSYFMNCYLVFEDSGVISHLVIPFKNISDYNSYITSQEFNSENSNINSAYFDRIDVGLSQEKSAFLSSQMQDTKSPFIKIPKTYSEVTSINDKYLLNKILTNKKLEFVIPKYELKYPNSNLYSNPITDFTRPDIMQQVKTFRYDLENKNKIFFDQKLYSLNPEGALFNSSSYDFKNNILLNKKLEKAVIYKKSGNAFVKTKNIVVYDVFSVDTYDSSQLENKTFINVYGILNKDYDFDSDDISCNILTDITDTDVLRIYDDNFLNHYKSYNRNYPVPYVEIDLKIQTSIFTDNINDMALDLGAAAANEISISQNNTGNRAILYNFLSTNSNYTTSFHEEDKLWSYGVPICSVSNGSSSNRFLYSYSKNKKYSFPIDKCSGYRYGVQEYSPVKQTTLFNKNSYDQFCDKTYDTQNYSFLKYEEGKYIEDPCVVKNFYNTNLRVITEDDARLLATNEGTNIDENLRHYYPFVESIDDTDLSYLYS